MSDFAREGQPGRYRTRISDIQCPRVDACGYRCEAGRGDHEGPHLFEEHAHHPTIPKDAVLVTEETLAAALTDVRMMRDWLTMEGIADSLSASEGADSYASQ